ncbi:glycosyltransferase [Synechococcus sp. AH-779-G23]|nr:glycosyltransferase [Synechococcus sp. AH-779-G23]MDA9638943.1 glycosyltransferase [Synechococcus sp. AH-779-G23]
MQILIIHKGFPGQFKHLIPVLQERGNQIISITSTRQKPSIPNGVYNINYYINKPNGSDTFPLASEIETKIIRGDAVAKAAQSLKARGLQPDLIMGHPGWGEMLFLHDVWPQVPQLHYVEFFHGVPGTDNDIKDIHSSTISLSSKTRATVKNTNLLTNLNQMKTGITPTVFQHSLLPEWAQLKTKIIHDGIDTKWLKPNNSAQLTIPNGLVFKYGDPVITFINRTYEPYRGVHIFLDALAKLQKKNPSVHAVMVGKDTPRVSYGAHRRDGKGWLTALKEQYGNHLDWSRIHPIGTVKHSTLKLVYQISAAHIYLSYPFVLSWSLLEAMSCGGLVIGSNTKPVKELITNNQTGLLVPFEDSSLLSTVISEVLEKPNSFNKLRSQARELIAKNYHIEDCLYEQVDLLNSVANQ